MKSAVPVHKVQRLPRALQLKVPKVLRTKCRSCDETCYWRCLKCCACHEICTSNAQSAAPATKPASGGAQSAAPATKSAVPVHKVLLLPRNLLLEMLKVLRVPRNLHIQIHIAQRCQGSLQWQAQLFVRDILFLIQLIFFLIGSRNFLFDIFFIFDSPAIKGRVVRSGVIKGGVLDLRVFHLTAPP